MLRYSKLSIGTMWLRSLGEVNRSKISRGSIVGRGGARLAVCKKGVRDVTRETIVYSKVCLEKRGDENGVIGAQPHTHSRGTGPPGLRASGERRHRARLDIRDARLAPTPGGGGADLSWVTWRRCAGPWDWP